MYINAFDIHVLAAVEQYLHCGKYVANQTILLVRYYLNSQ